MDRTDEERARRNSLRAPLVIVAAVGAVGYAAGMIAANDTNPATWIVAAVPVMLAIGLALIFHRLATRRARPTTGADEPRSESAVLIWLFGATALVQAAAAIVVERPWGRVMAIIACALSLAAATLFWLQRRRARRNRGLEPASRRAKGHLRRLAGDQEE